MYSLWIGHCEKLADVNECGIVLVLFVAVVFREVLGAGVHVRIKDIFLAVNRDFNPAVLVLTGNSLQTTAD